MKKIESFNFQEGDRIYNKYEIIELLGDGWQGEVYLVREISTGIERAAKFFFPHRNKYGRTSKLYAKKLHKLKNCGLLIQYYGQDTLFIDGQEVVFLISEYIEGEILSEYLKRQSGNRLNPFTALHLLHALAKGMEAVHRMKEYHGDLHTDNIIVERSGLSFQLKVLDLFNWGRASGENIHHDVVDMINVFYEVLGGKKHYANLPDEIKDICGGLKKSLILKKFNTAGKLRGYIENMEWK
ncbi:serine/threonine protein kinase [Candidatus Woesearchaeota archaeon CG10_big_fil_rev_8_21_14_0_10_34_8]|nr:MAG: serine/threonine protein kinase [Candidatus Woesearchaeota archaeon CG10_big_fil_rev_8_21_14_0_10_34_8]